MGSRIMHLLVADMAAEKLKIRDKASFLLGGIAPDAVSPKELSHFYTGVDCRILLGRLIMKLSLKSTGMQAIMPISLDIMRI